LLRALDLRARYRVSCMHVRVRAAARLPTCCFIE
jgi:hypothetical protein